MNTRQKRTLLTGLVVILTIGPLQAAKPTTKPTTQPAPRRIDLTVSKKTTRILGPLNKDGTPNYVAYLDTKYSKGVTKANNAAIPLIKILGPDYLSTSNAKDICAALKVPIPVKGPNTFVLFRDRIDKTLSPEDIETWGEKYEDLTDNPPKPWSAKQYPIIAKWLKSNKTSLDATLTAMKRTRYYVPIITHGKHKLVATISVGPISGYRNLNNALIARAMLRLGSNNPRKAWTDLMASRRLARRVGRGCTLIDSLGAIAIETRACQGCNAIAASGKLTGAQARAFLAEMQQLAPLPEMIDKIDESERFVLLDCIVMLARGWKRTGLISLNMQLNELAEMVSVPSPIITPLNAKKLNWNKILLMANS